jgi:hypothetical protein
MLVVGARCSSRSKIQSSRIAELIVLACHEFMDGKLWSNPVDAANSIRVFGGWTLQIQMGPFQV